MASKMEAKTATMIYNQLCNVLDNRKWTYERHDEDLIVRFRVHGEDVPMDFVFGVDVERQLLRLKSKLPFNFAEDKRMEGAIATSSVNYMLVDGYFEYDITDGETSFKITTSCRDSLISNETIEYMLRCALFVVEEFNDKFMMISKGYMSLEQFFNSIN